MVCVIVFLRCKNLNVDFVEIDLDTKSVIDLISNSKSINSPLMTVDCWLPRRFCIV